MTPDPLCEREHLPRTTCPACLMFSRVRADERARWEPREAVTKGHAPMCPCRKCYPKGYES